MLRVLFTTVWLCSLAFGVLFMANYSTKPGHSNVAVSAWPQDCRIERQAGESLLLVYLHPHCPCSRATISELSQMLVGHHDLSVCVCFYCPKSANSDWPLGSLYEQASRLSSRKPWHDVGGLEAKRLGILTSGHILFFNENGLLCFSGGVTSGRGHEGDNPGSSRLKEALDASEDTRSQSVSVFPVYGCEIENRS